MGLTTICNAYLVTKSIFLCLKLKRPSTEVTMRLGTVKNVLTSSEAHQAYSKLIDRSKIIPWTPLEDSSGISNIFLR